MLNKFRKDLERFIEVEQITKGSILYLLSSQALWAIAIYRLGYWVHRGFKIKFISFIPKVICFLFFKIIEIFTGISIPFSVQIGEGFYIGHFGGIIINGCVVIGRNCSIAPGVVIGTKGAGRTGVPIIGDNVFIGSGAKVLGNIKIGNNVKIGANAVVITDAPDNTVWVGVPAKIIEKRT